jgi:hypothetical protein
MLQKKFNYQDIPRVTVDGRRYYATPDGNRLPSVTMILDRTKPEENRRALREWKQRVGAERAQQITTEAANRGTRMHSFLERYIRDGAMPARPGNPFSWPSYAMAETVIQQGLQNVQEFWGVEIPLYFPGIYAGTTDGAGLHLSSEAILDYKQTNKPKKEEWIDDYKLQLAAYAEAHNEVYGTRIKKGVILMCVRPDVDANNQILKAPRYQEFVIEGAAFEHYRQEWWKRVEQYYTLNT